MDEKDVQIAEIKKEIDSLKHRMNKVEKNQDENQETVHKMELIVNTLVNKVDNLVDAVSKLINKFDKLENEPREFNKQVKVGVAIAVLSTIFSSALTAFLCLSK